MVKKISGKQRKTPRQRLAAISLYCSTRAGLEALAPVLCHEIKALIGAASAALYWLDEEQKPVGYYHEDAPPMPRQLFQSQFEELFDAPGEMSAIWLARQTGQSIGRLINPPDCFYNSNVYNLLIKGCGHHHTLDVRIDVNGVGRAMLALFRVESQPFSDNVVKAVAVIQPLLQQAINNAQSTPNWREDTSLNGSLMVSGDGKQLIACNDSASRLLANASLIGQNLSCNPHQISQPPLFISSLLSADGLPETVCEVYPVPGGRLSVRAVWMKHIQGPHQGGFWAVHIQMLVCREIDMVNIVLDCELSPLQREIALFALLGGRRAECTRRFDISNAALKLHVRNILHAFGVENWNELAKFGTAMAV